MTDQTTLAGIFGAAERGSMPPADGVIRVLRQPPNGDAAVVAFTAHIVIAADVESAWAAERLPSGDLSAPLNPPFLESLGEWTGRRVSAIDMTMLAPPLDGPPPVRLSEQTDSAHPRVRRARRYRRDVRVWTIEGGVVVIGRGLGGRYEAAFEVDTGRRDRGLGRTLARSARHLVRSVDPGAAGVWAQVSPGNAASVRVLLAAGFHPVGSEALLVPTQQALEASGPCEAGGARSNAPGR